MVELCREICLVIVPYWEPGAEPGAAGPIVGGEGVGTAMGMPILLLPLFSRLPLPPLLPLCVLGLWFKEAVLPGLC